MGSSSKKGGRRYYYRHYISLHTGVAQKMDEITSIRLGDREVWSGRISRSSVFNISDEEIFGGPEREGGINGGLTILMGEDHQVLPPYLRAKFDPAISNMIPSYRGMTSLFFHDSVVAAYDGKPIADLYDVAAGTVTPGDPGFYIQANSPYLRALNVVGSRSAKGLSRVYEKIPRALTGVSSGRALDSDDESPSGSSARPFDANPAHILFELHTNRDFGAGLPISRIDINSFEYAAETLHRENFGMSFKWVRQGRVRDIVLEVLDHINGLLYEDPRTGLLSLKLIRRDYDVNDLKSADTSNCVVTDFQRKTEELINEVVVTYTHPETYEEQSITVQDLGGLAAEGGTVSTGRNYYGVHDAELAKRLGERDLRLESYPLATAEIDLFREFWDVRPGDVIRLRSPEDADDTIIMRVISTEDDTTGSRAVRIRAVEDIFSLDSSQIVTLPTELFDNFGTSTGRYGHIQALTMPYTFSVLAGLREAGDDGEDYPEVHFGALASSADTGIDFYDITGRIMGPLGSSRFGTLSTNSIVPRGMLCNTIDAAAETTVHPPDMISNGKSPEVETLLIIGTGGDDDIEIAGIRSIGADGSYIVRRGLLDTIPRTWAAGTPVWFVSRSMTFWDRTPRAAFENTQYRIHAKGRLRTASPDDLALQNFTLGERPYQPFRPANVTVGGVSFGSYFSPARRIVPVSWSNRNRYSEDATFLAWDDDTVTPEVGQTTEIEILRLPSREVLWSQTGLTGTSYVIPQTVAVNDLIAEERVTVRILSRRDGLPSLQAHEIEVRFPAPRESGYGTRYGESYGN